MRIHLKLSPNNKAIPFNYQEQLTGTIHKWIGKNQIHDLISFYSFSWLSGGKTKSNNLDFSNGASWFISAWDDKLIKTIISSIRTQPSVAFGLEVKEIIIQENPSFGNLSTFNLSSPILIKRKIGSKEKHYIYSDPDADSLLTETLKTKLKQSGNINLNVSVRFDKSYNNPKTKLITYNGIHNKTSYCPVIIEGDEKAIQFAWCVGIGNSTGIGFGALK